MCWSAKFKISPRFVEQITCEAPQFPTAINYGPNIIEANEEPELFLIPLSLFMIFSWVSLNAWIIYFSGFC